MGTDEETFEGSASEDDEQASLLKTTNSGLTVEQFEQKEASRNLLSTNDLKKLILSRQF